MGIEERQVASMKDSLRRLLVECSNQMELYEFLTTPTVLHELDQKYFQ
jgi:hypothetical protein